MFSMYYKISLAPNLKLFLTVLVYPPFLAFIPIRLDLLSYVSGESQRLRYKMFEDIEGAYACFRRLNGTHQFGCSCKLFKGLTYCF